MYQYKKIGPWKSINTHKNKLKFAGNFLFTRISFSVYYTPTDTGEIKKIPEYELGNYQIEQRRLYYCFAERILYTGFFRFQSL